MNIAMFTNTYLPFVGGVPKSVQSFVEELEKRGNRCLVVAPTFPDAKKSEGNVVRVKAIQNFNGSDFSVSMPDSRKIHEVLNDFNPDIIHSHHPFLLGDAALREARKRQLPIVFTHHTLYERYTHYVPFHSETMKNLVVQLAVKYCNMVDHVIAPSKSVMDYLETLGVETAMSEVPTGVEVEEYQSGDGSQAREKWDIPEDALLFGHVGRLAKEKNLLFLCEAVRKGLQELESAFFVVVGEGEDTDALKEIFEDEEWGKRVIFTGSLTGADLVNAYTAMDCFLFSSTSETQGMVLAEAMAAGTPVIALDAPGAREIVRDQENGILLSGDSSEEDFSQAMEAFAEDWDEGTRLSEGAQETARDFSKERSNEKLLKVYEKAEEANQQRSKYKKEWNDWDSLMSQIQTEWQLLVEKAESIIDAMGDSEKQRKELK